MPPSLPSPAPPPHCPLYKSPLPPKNKYWNPSYSSSSIKELNPVYDVENRFIFLLLFSDDQPFRIDANFSVKFCVCLCILWFLFWRQSVIITGGNNFFFRRRAIYISSYFFSFSFLSLMWEETTSQGTKAVKCVTYWIETSGKCLILRLY